MVRAAEGRRGAPTCRCGRKAAWGEAGPAHGAHGRSLRRRACPAPPPPRSAVRKRMTPDTNRAVPCRVHPASSTDPQTNLNRTAVGAGVPGSVPPGSLPTSGCQDRGGTAGAARGREDCCPWVRCPPGNVRDWRKGGGARRGRGARIPGAESAESGLRENWLRIKGTAGGGRFEKQQYLY